MSHLSQLKKTKMTLSASEFIYILEFMLQLIHIYNFINLTKTNKSVCIFYDYIKLKVTIR